MKFSSLKLKVNKIATLEGHKDAIYSIIPTFQPHQFISAGGDGMVVSWDLANLKDGTLIANVKNSIYGITFVPNYNHLLIGNNYEGIHWVDLTTNKEIRSLKCTDKIIYTIATSSARASKPTPLRFLTIKLVF